MTIKNPTTDELEVKVQPNVTLGGNKLYGYADLDKDKIVVATKPRDVLNTIIHEKLHVNYPNMDHDKIYENAAKIEAAMTIPEMARELLDIHDRSMNPPYKREITFTEASNIISSNKNE